MIFRKKRKFDIILYLNYHCISEYMHKFLQLAKIARYFLKIFYKIISSFYFASSKLDLPKQSELNGAICRSFD